MKLLRWRHLGMGAVVLGLLALGAPAPIEARKDDSKPAAKEKDAGEPVDVTDLGSSFQLVEYGRASEAPEALIMAAGLLRVAARAELKVLDAKPEVEGPGKDKAPKALAKPDLKKEAKDLIDEAEVMSAKKKTNLSALIKVLRNRKLPTDGAGVVKYLGYTVEGGQTHVLKLKATADEGTDLAIRANAPVLVSVIRENNKNVLAATLTPGGNLHFEPNVSEGTVSRGVKGGPVKHHPKPHEKHHGHHRDHHKPIKRRGITADGDCTILIRITNPTDQPIEYTLFLN